MTLIGQPESYSDILKRIFTVSVAVGIACTFVLAAVSPAFHTFLESWKVEAKIGILEGGIKALYVLIPLLVALVSRMFLLHDRISDLLGIRRRFDTRFILRPLALGVGLPGDGPKWNQIKTNRQVAMTRAFYPYASFIEPKIDKQMVRTAADRWGWFWCMVEPQAILLITAAICGLIGSWNTVIGLVTGMIVLTLFALVLWVQLFRGAQMQVNEILIDEGRRTEVLAALNVIIGAQPLVSH